jgi:adenylate kinase family enzyme
MERICIIGIAGSGKSTLARILGIDLHLPVLHLDTVYWLPNWEVAPETTFQEAHDQWMNYTRWVIDGNYRKTLPSRLEHADTVIHLDYSTYSGLWGAIKRFFIYRHKSRLDITTGCIEKLDWAFISWILHFRKKVRPLLIEEISKHHHLQVLTFRNRRQLSRYILTKIPHNSPND